jgi:DNA-binding NarL/FixJ family response regulator
MAKPPPKTGGATLARKSELAIARSSKAAFSDILIVEDNVKEADRLKSTLNTIFNYKSEIRHAKTLGAALDCVIARKPDLIFLDDLLKPSDDATETIPFLRRCGYSGPIVVVSSVLTRPRRALLINATAVECIHKDDLDGTSVEEALALVYKKLSTSTT